MVHSPNQKQSLLPLSFFPRYTRRPSPPAPELPPSAQTSPEPAEIPTLASLRGKREQRVYEKSYYIPVNIDETASASGVESVGGKHRNLCVRAMGNVGKKVVSVKRKGQEIGEVISVKQDLRMEIEGRREGEERERGRKGREKDKRERQQRKGAKRESVESTEKGGIKKRKRPVIEIQDTDADDDDPISPVDVRRGDSNATDSTGTMLGGGTLFSLESLENVEMMDLMDREDSADSDYVEPISRISSEQEEEEDEEKEEEEKEEEEGEEENAEEEEPIRTSNRKKVLLDSSQSSPSPLRSPSPPRVFKPQIRRPMIRVPKGEPTKTPRRKYVNGLYESSDSCSVSPSTGPLTPRGRNRRVSPHIVGPKYKKQCIKGSENTIPPIDTKPTSPSRSHHESKPSQSPVNTSRCPVSQPPCLRMSLTGNDKDIFTIPLSEVLTPTELETAIQSHFPQPTDTYIKLTDERGDIMKLSFWKGGVWKDGLRLRVEYRDKISGGCGSRTTEKSVKVGIVDAGVQTEEVEVYGIGWAERREVEIVEEQTERLKMKVEKEIADRIAVRVKEERESMEQERDREREKFREEKAHLHQQQKQREKEIEELGLELQFGSQPQVKEFPPLFSVGAPPKSEKPMPTPNTTANTSRNSSTGLASPTKIQFAMLSLSPAAVRPGSLPNQRQSAQEQKASSKKWNPSTNADTGSESGSDLSLDLSWNSPKEQVASAEKQKSKSKSKSKPRNTDNTPTSATGGGGLCKEVPSWVLKKQKSRECSLSLNSTPKKRIGVSPSTGSNPASNQSQEELSLFIGSSQLTDSSVESSPRLRTPVGNELTPLQEVRAPVTPTKDSAIRKGGTPICLARRSGKAGLARGGGVLGSVVRAGRGGSKESAQAGEGKEGKNICEEWYTLGTGR